MAGTLSPPRPGRCGLLCWRLQLCATVLSLQVSPEVSGAPPQSFSSLLHSGADLHLSIEWQLSQPFCPFSILFLTGISSNKIKTFNPILEDMDWQTWYCIHPSSKINSYQHFPTFASSPLSSSFLPPMKWFTANPRQNAISLLEELLLIIHEFWICKFTYC